jgi:hypothetical protein
LCYLVNKVTISCYIIIYKGNEESKLQKAYTLTIFILKHQLNIMYILIHVLIKIGLFIFSSQKLLLELME